MGFIDRYIRALGASNLESGAQPGQADPLLAAAFAAAGKSGELGPLLHRVKYADDPMRDAGNLRQLLHFWTAEVTRRGRARKWVPENTAWNTQSAHKFYHLVAELSLAHWIEGGCKQCGGTGTIETRPCSDCKGRGEAPIDHPGGFVRERVKDMVSELHGIAGRHAARANARLNDK